VHTDDADVDVNTSDDVVVVSTADDEIIVDVSPVNRGFADAEPGSGPSGRGRRVLVAGVVVAFVAVVVWLRRRRRSTD
jgi:hypothetical protein